MSKFKTINRNHECAICKNTKGRCKSTDDLWLCGTYVDSDAGVAGWAWRKTDRSGLWGVFAPTENKVNFNQPTQSVADRIAETKRQLAEDLARYARGLTVAERDTEAEKLLGVVGLTPQHRETLIQKGVPESLLADFGSVHKHKKVEGVNPKFPGIRENSSLNVCNSGILVPFYSHTGEIQGFQLRNDNRGGSRYIWLLGDHGNSSHLQDGTLPLTTIIPNTVEKPRGLGFSEGAIKSMVVAYQRNEMVVGASGANWLGGKNQLKAAIAHARTLGIPLETAPLYIDAGMVAEVYQNGSIGNSNILQHCFNLKNFLAEEGIELQVAWWGQLTKQGATGLDADDLLLAGRGNEITLISFDKFMGMWHPDMLAKILATLSAGQRSEESDRLARLAIAQEIAQGKEVKAIKDKQRWRNQKKFTSTKTVNEKFFKLNDEDLKGFVNRSFWLLAVKSGLGTGKTEFFCKTLLHLASEKWLMLGYRNWLLLQSIERANKYLQKVNAKPFLHLLTAADAIAELPKPDYKIANCVDSLIQFLPEHFQGVNLVLDELMGTLSHLLTGSTCKKHRQLILQRFVQVIQSAKRILVMDGNLADWAVDLISSIRGTDKGIEKIENLHPVDRLDIEFFLGCLDSIDLGKFNPNDRIDLIKRIKFVLQAGKRIAVFTDSQNEAETLDRLLTELGIKTLRVDSKTGTEFYIQKEFLPDPNEYLNNNQVECLICTPTCESGIDINVRGYFSHAYYLFFGVLQVDSLTQMIGRIRDPHVLRHVWVAERQYENDEGLNSYCPDEWNRAIVAIQNQLAEQYCDGILDITAQAEAMKRFKVALERLNQNPFANAYRTLLSVHNYEKSHLRDCLREMLAAKHELKDTTGIKDKSESKANRKEKKKTKTNEVDEIYNADEIEETQAGEISARLGSSWEDRVKVIKFNYLELLAGIKDEVLADGSSAWNTNLVYRLRFEREYYYRMKLYFCLTHPDIAKTIYHDRWEKTLTSDNPLDTPFLGDIDIFPLVTNALSELNILNFLLAENLAKEYTANSPEILNVWQAGKNKKIERVLGKAGSSSIAYFNGLLALVGIKTTDRQEKTTGKRYYKIDVASLNDPTRQIVLKCVARRYQLRVQRIAEAAERRQREAALKLTSIVASIPPALVQFVQKYDRCPVWSQTPAQQYRDARKKRQLSDEFKAVLETIFGLAEDGSAIETTWLDEAIVGNPELKDRHHVWREISRSGFDDDEKRFVEKLLVSEGGAAIDLMKTAAIPEENIKKAIALAVNLHPTPLLRQAELTQFLAIAFPPAPTPSTPDSVSVPEVTALYISVYKYRSAVTSHLAKNLESGEGGIGGVANSEKTGEAGSDVPSLAVRWANFLGQLVAGGEATLDRLVATLAKLKGKKKLKQAIALHLTEATKQYLNQVRHQYGC